MTPRGRPGHVIFQSNASATSSSIVDIQWTAIVLRLLKVITVRDTGYIIMQTPPHAKGAVQLA